jgi:hypothetical protein
MVVKASLSKKQNPISKITIAKSDGEVVQAVKHLSSKQVVMSSNPHTVKRKERKCNTTNYSLI